MEMGPACQRLVQHPNSEFWKQNPHQNLCSRNLPATPPQQNLVSGMLLVCNRILQNMWFSMTNICSMTEHGVLFCNISDLFPQRKNLWIFSPQLSRNYSIANCLLALPVGHRSPARDNSIVFVTFFLFLLACLLATWSVQAQRSGIFFC